MNNKEFCVFILTHGRPDNVKTYATLKKCGYTGPIYFVVDNEDATAQKYIANFGAERVKIFDKKAYADSIDEGNNFDERRVIVHARNACFEIARLVGVKYFIELDDDYTQFRYRWIDEKYITIGQAKNLDRYFDAYLEFYKKTPCASIAFAQGGDFIGGAGSSMLTDYKRRARKCMNSFICSTDREFRFVGAINEDVNTYTTLANRGAIFLTLPYLAIEQAATQSQGGGMTDAYVASGTYIKSFHTVIMHPSGVSASMMISVNPRIHHKINWEATTPMILRERHKKT